MILLLFLHWNAPMGPTPTQLPEREFLHWTNFLPDNLVKLARDSTIQNRHKFNPTTVVGGESGHRQSQVVWHYECMDLYVEFSNYLRDFFPAMRQIFPKVLEFSTVEMQLTTHGNGDFFKRHQDNQTEDTKLREITYVYYFGLFDDQRRFSGGDLVIDVPSGRRVIVHPHHNTLVAFDSTYFHEVTPVSACNTWEHCRATLNGWIRRIA